MRHECNVVTNLKHALIIVFIVSLGILGYGQVNITSAVDFNVKDVNSHSHHLFEYLNDNKIVVLDFFTTTCGPCQTYASHVSEAYELFGCNGGNVVFLGINWGSDNDEVRLFDSTWGAQYPGISGIQGGGNTVVDNYQVMSYPTVCVITPDHLIFDNYIWLPEYDSIVHVVLAAGGIPQQCTVGAGTQHSNSQLQLIQSFTGEFQIINFENTKGNLILNIYTIDGKLAFRKTISPTDIIEFSPHLNSGFYILRLTSNERLVGFSKIIIP